ncbi:MAG: hypothetical protein ACOY5U_09430 [Pseudomonadota bacterium]
MNELTPMPTKAPPAVARSSGGRSAARVLQAAHELERPWRLVEALGRDFPEWYRGIYRSPPTLEQIRRPDRHGDEAHRDATEALAKLPPKARLDEIIEALDALRAAKPDRPQALALISTMVDGFPNARPHNPEVYVETLLHEVMSAGYPSAVVARATRLIAREQKFLPTAAELLEVCEKAAFSRAGYDSYVLARDRVVELTGLLEEADRLGPRDLDQEWRDRLYVVAAGEPWDRGWGYPPGDLGCLVPKHILAEFGYGEEAEELEADGFPKVRF